MSAENIINIEFWQVVSFFLTFLGVCFGFGKILFAQFKTALDDRLALLEKMQASGAPSRWVAMVEQVVQMDAEDQKRSLGDSLPPGLVLL